MQIGYQAIYPCLLERSGKIILDVPGSVGLGLYGRCGAGLGGAVFIRIL